MLVGWSPAFPLGAAALVTLLLAPCRPADVAGFVIPIVVDAVKTVFRRRPPADISQERLVTVAPLGTDRDPAPAVVGVVAMIDVLASNLHAAPGHVLGRLRADSRLSMSQARLRGDLSACVRTEPPASCSDIPWPHTERSAAMFACPISRLSKGRPTTGVRAETCFPDSDLSRPREEGSSARLTGSRGGRLTGHQVTPGVNPRLFAQRGGTLRCNFTTYDQEEAA